MLEAVGLFLDYESIYNNALIRGCKIACRQLNLQLYVFMGSNIGYLEPNQTFLDDEYLDYPLNKARFDVCDVIIIPYTRQVQATSKVEDYFKVHFPHKRVVFLNAEVPGFSWVKYDNYTGIQETIDFMVNHNHVNKIAFIGGGQYALETRERWQAYCQALEKNNLAYDENLVIFGLFATKCGQIFTYK